MTEGRPGEHRLLERLGRSIAWLLPLAMLGLSGLLALARWPEYWLWIAPEQTPMTFFQALLLYTAAFGAGLTALAIRLGGGPGPEDERAAGPAGASQPEFAWWVLLASGFFFLMLDERFALHERLRDNLLADLGWRLPWGAPGDYLLLLYVIVALPFLPGILRAVGGDRQVLRLFLPGVLLAALAVAADSLDFTAMTPTAERIEQTLEEVVEGLADAFLAGAMLRSFLVRLEGLLTPSGRPHRDRLHLQ